ncbi:MAG: VCBS repeat-containing protein [Akkermansiaceae bacterium]|nr:VCBS repeat-containing protein [Akkermansiaceae bacterium]
MKRLLRALICGGLALLVLPQARAEKMWDAEVCTSRCMAQLKVLGTALKKDQLLGEDTKKLYAHGGAYFPLRPEILNHSSHGKLQVVEGAFPVENNHNATKQGDSVLRDWVQGLKVERTSFKITGVEKVGLNTVKTRVLAGMYGSDSEGRRGERHGTWQIDWDLAGDVPLITGLKGMSYSAAYWTNESLLQDKSAYLFSSAPDAWMQLRIPANEWLQQMSNEVARTQNFYQGLAIADVNGDGLEDVFICQGDGLLNRLLIQTATGEVKDITKEAGLDLLDRTRAAVFGDLDNDGDADIVLATYKALLIYRNDGSGKFTQEHALMDHFPSLFSLSLADYDQDGLLDIYACDYYKNEHKTRFATRPGPDLFQDATNGGENKLFRNISKGGTLSFEDVTEKTGLNKNNHHFSLACSWHDFDDDGDLDLYVANDFGRNNLFRNDRGVFTDVIDEARAQDQNFSMNAAWGDWNRDGLSDLYVSNMFSSAGKRITFQKSFKPTRAEKDRRQIQHLSRGNSLFTQGEGNRFREEAYPLGVWLGRWAWSSHFADLDHNGWQDLMVANGYLTSKKKDDL